MELIFCERAAILACEAPVDLGAGLVRLLCAKADDVAKSTTKNWQNITREKSLKMIRLKF